MASARERDRDIKQEGDGACWQLDRHEGCVAAVLSCTRIDSGLPNSPKRISIMRRHPEIDHHGRDRKWGHVRHDWING